MAKKKLKSKPNVGQPPTQQQQRAINQGKYPPSTIAPGRKVKSTHRKGKQPKRKLV